jgi:hypothetical protein
MQSFFFIPRYTCEYTKYCSMATLTGAKTGPNGLVSALPQHAVTVLLTQANGGAHCYYVRRVDLNMALCLHSPCYLNRYLLRNCVLSTSATKRRFTQFTCARSPAARSTEVPRELFEYTSGRWMCAKAPKMMVSCITNINS